MKMFVRGTITPTAMIFIFISLFISNSYLKYSMSAAVLQKYRFEEAKALYLAETGINIEGLPVLERITDPVLLVPDGVPFSDMGTYRDVYCSTYSLEDDGITIFYASGFGESSFKNTLGEQVTIARQVELNMVPDNLANYMYFTGSEEPGGGPGLGSYVSFGRGDTLYGLVHTNGHMRMSSSGCPDFSNADVTAANGITYFGCEPEHWGDVNDSAEVIKWPPHDAVERAKVNATYTFTADDYLWRHFGQDTLIMTDIEFHSGGFTMKQWAYQIPPIGAEGPPPTNFRWDTSTEAADLDEESISFNAAWDTLSGLYLADTIYIDNHDFDGNNILDNVLEEYSVGDTIAVTATDPDSLKIWLGVIVDISTNLSGAVFGVNYIEQSFQNQFVDNEEVTLSFIASIDNSIPFNAFAYYHNHPNDGIAQCNSSGFHHFDFTEPTNEADYVTPPTPYYNSEPSVIYVRNGQVRVKGIVDGKFTVVTDQFTEYRRSDNPSIWDRVWNNIWLMDDIIYEDSNEETGEVPYGSPNRLGLISGANIIIANTMANGARNSTYGEDIIINGALLAMADSFVAHYWQNTVSNTSVDVSVPNFENPTSSLGDGRGPRRNPNSLTDQFTGSDIRGAVILWGSMAQTKRGYMKRNNPGPYPISPGIGYDKRYYYDYNFFDFSPPPYFPEAKNVDGSSDFMIRSYGEVPVKLTQDNPQ